MRNFSRYKLVSSLSLKFSAKFRLQLVFGFGRKILFVQVALFLFLVVTILQPQHIPTPVLHKMAEFD